MAKISVPEGCTPIATVHKNSCAVSTILTCDNSFLILGYTSDRPEVAHMYDSNWTLTGFLYQANSETRFDVDLSRGKGMNLQDLLTDGQDTESRTMLFSTRVVKNREFVMDGQYQMTDQEVDLGGDTYRIGKFQRTLQREGIAGSRLDFEYDFYVSEAENIFIEGAFTRSAEDRQSERVDQTPRDIRFEGDPGFLATSSDFGCVN
ncbi:MAG: hypothetical protein AAF408_02055 [Pseudomonadota bacterium]